VTTQASSPMATPRSPSESAQSGTTENSPTAFSDTNAPASPLRRVPVQGRSVARVARMLDACAELVDEIGYEALTTTLLAERAGVAIGSIYQFFPDKRAVVQALTLRNLEAYLDRLAARFTNTEFSQWWDGVDAAIDEYIAMHRDVPGFRTLHVVHAGVVQHLQRIGHRLPDRDRGRDRGRADQVGLPARHRRRSSHLERSEVPDSRVPDPARARLALI
jgi:AcrR family transcriptional regulator